jgi:hypothetical protein
MRQLVMTIFWPAFLMAGVLEALIFVVVDPTDLRWFGGDAVGLSVEAVYTVTFLIIWLTMVSSGALTALLLRSADEVNRQSADHPA